MKKIDMDLAVVRNVSSVKNTAVLKSVAQWHASGKRRNNKRNAAIAAIINEEVEKRK